MKTISWMSLGLTFLLFCLLPTTYMAATISQNSAPMSYTQVLTNQPATKMVQMSRTDIEKQLGRQLNWRERVGLWSYKRQLKAALKQPTTEVACSKIDPLALTSIISGAAALFILPLFLGITAIVTGILALNNIRKHNQQIMDKENRAYMTDTCQHRGNTLAIVGLALGGVALILFLLIFAIVLAI